MVVLKTEIDVTDFVRGCVFMGTGGGGPQQVGLRYLLEVIRRGRLNRCATISGNVLGDEKAGGTVHVAFGNNVSMGRTVDVPLHVDWR